jgi:hypothetical protein
VIPNTATNPINQKMKTPLRILKGLLAAACAVAFAAILLTHPQAPARADGFNNYGEVAVISGGTNNIAAATTNTAYAATIDLHRQEWIALRISYTSTLTNGLTTIFRFKPSLDGTTNDNVGTSFDVTVTGNGTNNVCVVTNMSVGAIGYLKLTQIEHVNTTAALTNLYVSYAIKR